MSSLLFGTFDGCPHYLSIDVLTLAKATLIAGELVFEAEAFRQLFNNRVSVNGLALLEKEIQILRNIGRNVRFRKFLRFADRFGKGLGRLGAGLNFVSAGLNVNTILTSDDSIDQARAGFGLAGNAIIAGASLAGPKGTAIALVGVLVTEQVVFVAAPAVAREVETAVKQADERFLPTHRDQSETERRGNIILRCSLSIFTCR